MIEIEGRKVGSEYKPYIIAEAGINFRDDIELGKSFIDAAADAGADAIKFQTHIADAEMVRSEMAQLDKENVFETVAECALTEEEHEELQAYCEERGITFLSTPFSVAAISLLRKLDVPAFKIGSGELTNYQILDKVASTNKPLIVSTGMSNYDTVTDAYEFLTERTDEFTLLYCVSSYPADLDDFNLDMISKMEQDFGVPIGLSDHSTGIKAAVLAMAHGADIIEKHFTIDRRLPGPDQAVSIEPSELERLVEYAEIYERTRGIEEYVLESETDVKEWARHSVVSTQDIEQGDKISADDVTTKRPATGIPAERFHDVIGKLAARDISKNEVLDDNDIESQPRN